MTVYHKPVLVHEVLEFLNPQPGGLYVDATLGGGGHTRAILVHQSQCKVIGIDWDQKALDINAPQLESEFGDRFQAIWGNFAQLPLLLKRAGIGRVDGVLADFGTSQYQIFSQPGFSFATDTRLDMRMSPAHQHVTAYDLVNKATEEELAYIFYEYSQERYGRKIARAMVEARKKGAIKTTGQLAKIVETVVPYRFHQKIHPATKVFQALRMAVNKELDNIKAFLHNAPIILNEHGRIVCISFHSLEDRMVKQHLKMHQNIFETLTHKVVTAQAEERLANPSSRSARLRAAELKVVKED